MTTDSPPLLEADVPANPFALFSQWYLAAKAAELPEPSAMTLATADAAGMPNARVVLMRGFDERGFVFYTNYQGQKATELAKNPQAALVFHWASLQRQVRVQGGVEKVSSGGIGRLFSFPSVRPSSWGRWCRRKARLIAGREFLEERLRELQAQYGETDPVPRPPHWGGYRVLAARHRILARPGKPAARPPALSPHG